VNIDWSNIKAFEIITPNDYESIFRVAGGNLNHLPMFEEFMFDRRPVPGWAVSVFMIICNVHIY
jgi:phytoene dehydrogenase-like protein